MSDHPKQPKATLVDRRRIPRKRNPAPYPQPSRSTTPTPSNRQGSSPGASAILPRNPESAPRRVDNWEDSLKGGDTAKTDDKSDTAQFMPVEQLIMCKSRVGLGVPEARVGNRVVTVD
ncbi:hypothetical protein B0H11DRAFT_1872521 [Mycena galericulata]|nr:hypothetical protein B0H11DRAFT_1872521 [Mycena galericulata]